MLVSIQITAYYPLITRLLLFHCLCLKWAFILSYDHIKPWLFFFPVGLWSCQVRFCLRSSRKCKSENGDYCQPSWDYLNPKRNVAFHQITFILFSLKAKSEWVTFEKRVETFYTQQRTTFIISNGKITKVFGCYCSICLIVSVTFNILKMGYHRFCHL